MSEDAAFDTADIREQAHRFKILMVLRSSIIGVLLAVLTIISQHS